MKRTRAAILCIVAWALSAQASADATAGDSGDRTYMVNDNWGLEVLAVAPVEDGIARVDGPTIASTKHLPPTVGFVYHLLPGARVHPYVGAGLNATVYLHEDGRDGLTSQTLELEPALGVATVVGVQMEFGRVFLDADVRYRNLDTRARLDGMELGIVRIDPVAFGLSIGLRL